MSPFDLAQRYVGIQEIAGDKDHPLVQWWLSLCGFSTDTHDEVPWCSAFVNGICWELRLPRSKSAMARSWLNVGVPLTNISQAQLGDIVVLSRGAVAAPAGHVGFYAAHDTDHVSVLGGNQSDGVCVKGFPIASVLSVRRIV